MTVYSPDRQALKEVSLLVDCLTIRGYKRLLPKDIPTELRTKRIDYVGATGK